MARQILRCCVIHWVMLVCAVWVCRRWLKTCTQKGLDCVNACDMVLASRISISILTMGRLIPPLSMERDDVSMFGCVCLPFQTNWLTSVWSWVMMFCGGGETEAWYPNSDIMNVLSTRTLPRIVRFHSDRDAALVLAF